MNLFSCFQETGGEQFGSNQIKLEEFSGSPVVRTFTAKPTQCSQNIKQNKTKQKSPKICKCFDPEILLRYCSTETFFFFFQQKLSCKCSTYLFKNAYLCIVCNSKTKEMTQMSINRMRQTYIYQHENMPQTQYEMTNKFMTVCFSVVDI